MQYNSFTFAAEECHILQSAISQQLKVLEDELGSTFRRVPFMRGGSPIRRTYCAFWEKDNVSPHVRLFYELLEQQFA